MKKFFNTSGIIYRDSSLKDKIDGMTDEEQYHVLATDGMLIKRPILITDDKEEKRISMNGNRRKDIKVGQKVKVVEKKNQRTGELTEGVIQRILTNSPNHPHGIKVKLNDGIVGRVKEIVEAAN